MQLNKCGILSHLTFSLVQSHFDSCKVVVWEAVTKAFLKNFNAFGKIGQLDDVFG